MDRIEYSVNFHPRVEARFEVVEKKESQDVQIVNQIHGAEGFEVTRDRECEKWEGDYLWTTSSLALGVFVADCTAILVYGKSFKNSKEQEIVSAIHAGWRGTAKGVLQAALEKFEGCEEKVAWMSPSICQQHYEVGLEVIDALSLRSSKMAIEHKPTKYLLDLGAYQKGILISLGVEVLRSSLCTYCQPEFVSYRRSGGQLKSRHLASIKLRATQ